MKNFTRHSFVAIALTGAILTAVNCTKTNQVIGNTTPPVTNTDTLNAISGTATYQAQGEHLPWSGDISAWANAPKLTVMATVPNPGNNIFTGFTGNSDSITMQAMYDANNIYFLVQWVADNRNCASSPWYYNPTTRLWAQESGAPTYSTGSTSVFRPAFIQDEFVIMFNINNSTRNFNTQSCYVACHVNSGYGVDTPQGGAMWTNGPTEFLDCWRARTVQVLNENQANDCYVWNGGGMLNKQQVPNDPQIKTTDGGFSNKQSLTITGKTVKENVPMYVYYPAASQYATYPTGTYANGGIFLSDTGTKALKVIAVDSNGVLTLAGGATIDPNVGTNYQQVGAGDGQYVIPGSILAAYTGGRADVTCNMFWTGNGWRLLFVRALNTNHTPNATINSVDDADFSSKADQPFGIGLMFNGADNQHAITNGLTLHFK